MTYLFDLELVQHWDYKRLISKGDDGHPDMMAFIWVERDWQYFIANALSLDSCELYSCHHWQQLSTDDDVPPDNIELTIPQHKAAEVSYRTCGMIDLHNQHCQDNLKMESKLEIKK